MRETPNKTPLVVLHDLVEVVLKEFHLEVGQVEAAVIVCSELVRDI